MGVRICRRGKGRSITDNALMKIQHEVMLNKPSGGPHQRQALNRAGEEETDRKRVPEASNTAEGQVRCLRLQGRSWRFVRCRRTGCDRMRPSRNARASHLRILDPLGRNIVKGGNGRNPRTSHRDVIHVSVSETCGQHRYHNQYQCRRMARRKKHIFTYREIHVAVNPIRSKTTTELSW